MELCGAEDGCCGAHWAARERGERGRRGRRGRREQRASRGKEESEGVKEAKVERERERESTALFSSLLSHRRRRKGEREKRKKKKKEKKEKEEERKIETAVEPFRRQRARQQRVLYQAEEVHSYETHRHSMRFDPERNSKGTERQRREKVERESLHV